MKTAFFQKMKEALKSLEDVYKRQLDDSNINAKLPQIFCQLQTNKTTTSQHSRFRMILINILLDFDSIFYCTQCKKIINTYSRKVRLCRLCLLYTSRDPAHSEQKQDFSH